MTNIFPIIRPVVVVADFRPNNCIIEAESDNLDLYTEEELEEILSALRKVCSQVTVFHSPAEFIDQIHNHAGSLLFPLWAGRVSRNRTALLSAVSEAYGMDYFGADAYTNIVGQDKSLAKQIARDFQLNSASSVLVHSIERLHLIELVKPPFVVKPNFQGSSIGISQRSFCKNAAEASNVTSELLRTFGQPVLVENFIEGSEATVTIFGRGRSISLFQAVVITDRTGKIDLSKTIWSYDLKKANNPLPILQRPINLSPIDEERLRQMFASLGKVELIRIDGRIRNGSFHFLEMNPEPYLSQFSSVHRAFEFQGYSYEEMFAQFLRPIEVNS